MAGHLPDGCTQRAIDEALYPTDIDLGTCADCGATTPVEDLVECAGNGGLKTCRKLVCPDCSYTCNEFGHRVSGDCMDDLYRCGECHEAHSSNLPECAA